MRAMAKTSRLGLMGWGVFVLLSGVGRAGDPVPDRERISCSFELLQGVLVTRCDSFPVHLWGPGWPGELKVMGGFTPGLFDPVRERMLLGRFPDAARRSGSRVPLSGTAERLLVVIDPGHGGEQLGAVGVSGVVEKDLVLAVARKTRRAFEGIPGVEVVMTRLRDDEISLWERVEVANQLGANVFISIHANAFTSPRLGGVETFFHSIEASGEEAKRVASAENAPGSKQAGASRDPLSYILQDMHGAEKLRDSSRLAHLVQEQLAEALPFENRGVMQADFIVLRDTRMPSVLLELGFLTNPREEKVLTRPEIHEKVAIAIRRGVLRYWALIKRKQVHGLLGGGSGP